MNTHTAQKQEAKHGQHTPWLWAIDSELPINSRSVIARTSGGLAISGNTQGPHDTQDDHLNALLIASAPELLAQLTAMTDAYAKAMKDAGVTHYPEALHVVRQARAAIAKSKGESK